MHTGSGNHYKDVYDDLYFQEEDHIDSVSKEFFRIISRENRDGVRIMKTFSKTPPESDQGSSVEHLVFWFNKKDDLLIRLSLGTIPEDEQALHQYKDLLWEIADSFEFID